MSLFDDIFGETIREMEKNESEFMARCTKIASESGKSVNDVRLLAMTISAVKDISEIEALAVIEKAIKRGDVK